MWRILSGKERKTYNFNHHSRNVKQWVFQEILLTYCWRIFTVSLEHQHTLKDFWCLNVEPQWVEIVDDIVKNTYLWHKWPIASKGCNVPDDDSPCAINITEGLYSSNPCDITKKQQVMHIKRLCGCNTSRNKRYLNNHNKISYLFYFLIRKNFTLWFCDLSHNWA